eukprot:NODE_367_length_10044_cov_0.769432.p2 type:complete len:660 gc:universal NODE_367_length_10044_cov_0.769432:5733-3754(-)
MSVKYYEKMALDDMAKFKAKLGKDALISMLEHLNFAQKYCLNIHKQEYYQIIISHILDELLIDISNAESSDFGKILYFSGNTDRLLPFFPFLATDAVPELLPFQSLEIRYDDAILLQALIRGLLEKLKFLKNKKQIEAKLRLSIPYSELTDKEPEYVHKIKDQFKINKATANNELLAVKTRIENIEIPLFLTKVWVEFRLWYMKIEKDCKCYPTVDQVDQWVGTDLLALESDYLQNSFKDFENKDDPRSEKDSDLEYYCKAFVQLWPLDKVDDHWHSGHSKYLLYSKALKGEIMSAKDNLSVQLKAELLAAVAESKCNLKTKVIKEKNKKKVKTEKPKKVKTEKPKKVKDPTNGWSIDQILEELGRLRIFNLAENKNNIVFRNTIDQSNTIAEYYSRSINMVQLPLLAKHAVEYIRPAEAITPKATKTKSVSVKLKNDSKVAPSTEDKAKPIGCRTLMHGKDVKLMKDQCTNIAYHSSAMLLTLVPSSMKGVYEEAADVAKLIYMILTVAKLFKPTVLVIEDIDLIFAKKLKSCDFNPKRFKKELIKQSKSLKPSDFVQIVGIAASPSESDVSSLKSYFNKILHLPGIREDEVLIRLEQISSQVSLVDVVKFKKMLCGISYEDFIAFEKYVLTHPNEGLILKYISSIEMTNWKLYNCFK